MPADGFRVFSEAPVASLARIAVLTWHAANSHVFTVPQLVLADHGRQVLGEAIIADVGDAHAKPIVVQDGFHLLRWDWADPRDLDGGIANGAHLAHAFRKVVRCACE